LPTPTRRTVRRGGPRSAYPSSQRGIERELPTRPGRRSQAATGLAKRGRSTCSAPQRTQPRSAPIRWTISWTYMMNCGEATPRSSSFSARHCQGQAGYPPGRGLAQQDQLTSGIDVRLGDQDGAQGSALRCRGSAFGSVHFGFADLLRAPGPFKAASLRSTRI
jgi:hypothetical protein